MEAIVDEFLLRGLTDVRWLAYMLATAYWETSHTIQPCRETLAPTDARAAAILEHSWRAKRMLWVKTPYWYPDENGVYWIGRGLVQLTFESNYRKLSVYVGVDLVAHPELAMDDKVAVKIMFEGMLKGLFTGRALNSYFNATLNDPVGARKIINGTDHDDQIAAVYQHFLSAIKGAM
jgi:hypothetical protein